jgi:hypothetical protein
MMKATRRIVILLLLLNLVIPITFAAAQEESGTLALKLRKDFGFGLGGRIQGSFTLSASGPVDLRRVDFIIDRVVVFQDDEHPFEYQFHTSDFELGNHRIEAVGTTSTGEILQSEVLQLEFISAEQGWKSAADIIIPLFIVIVIIVAIGITVTTLVTRQKGFRIGEYGHSGGAVCSRCGMPFSRHVFSPNLVIGKLERCPHCGKWGIVRRASAAELAQAESRFQAEGQKGRIESVDDQSQWERLIEESRFEDQ